MATSKVKISEQILRRLRKYSQDSDIDERELMLSIHQTLATLIRNRFFETKNSESQEVDGNLYYNIKDIKVKEDDRGGFYIDMPSSSIHLPFGVDIKRCGTAKGKGFIPVQNGINDLYCGLDSSCLEGNIGYYKNGNNIMFHNMNSSNKPNMVDLNMVVPFDALDEDDPISIPQDLVDSTIEMVFQKFVNTLNIPADKTSNSIDN